MQLKAIMGGAALAWIDRKERKFKTYRLCTMNEYYDEAN